MVCTFLKFYNVQKKAVKFNIHPDTEKNPMTMEVQLCQSWDDFM